MEKKEALAIMVWGILGLPLLIVMCSKASISSDDLREEILPLHYDVKVEKMKIERYVEVAGRNAKGEIVHYKILPFWGIGANTSVGDSLKKNANETIIRIVKTDTTLVLPLMYDGNVIE